MAETSLTKGLRAMNSNLVVESREIFSFSFQYFIESRALTQGVQIIETEHIFIGEFSYFEKYASQTVWAEANPI